jgi:heme/copper-type cytochrome/quinol oxidase subunit 2
MPVGRGNTPEVRIATGEKGVWTLNTAAWIIILVLLVVFGGIYWTARGRRMKSR